MTDMTIEQLQELLSWPSLHLASEDDLRKAFTQLLATMQREEKLREALQMLADEEWRDDSDPILAIARDKARTALRGEYPVKEEK